MFSEKKLIFSTNNNNNNNNNNKQICNAPCMPTEGCRGAVRYWSDGLVTAVKQECLKMSFKTMFRIAQDDFCRQTVTNDMCGVGE